MTTVYVVTRPIPVYEETEVLGVFLRREEAQYASDIYQAGDAIEIELGHIIPHLAGHKMFTVNLKRDGEVLNVRQSEIDTVTHDGLPVDLTTPGVKGIYSPETLRSTVSMYCMAKNKNDAKAYAKSSMDKIIAANLAAQPGFSEAEKRLTPLTKEFTVVINGVKQYGACTVAKLDANGELTFENRES